jgi:hypothetical protein
MVLGNFEVVNENLESLNVKHPNLFVTMLTMQEYESILHDISAIENSDIKKQKEIFRSMGKSEWTEMFVSLPKEMNFILRGYFILSALNNELGNVVNRFAITARVAAESLDQIDESTFLERSWFKIKLKFRSFINSIILFLFAFVPKSFITYFIEENKKQ